MIKNKKSLLVKGLIYDLVGMASMVIPVVGPFLDLAWAPYAASQMSKMYPGKKGKLAAVLVFVEEILPFTDIIPSFTLMWVYTFIFSNESSSTGSKIYEAEVIN
jgi:hypothetical protein